MCTIRHEAGMKCSGMNMGHSHMGAGHDCSKGCDHACMEQCKINGMNCSGGGSCSEACMKACKEKGIECGSGKACPAMGGSCCSMKEENHNCAQGCSKECMEKCKSNGMNCEGKMKDCCTK